MKKLYIMILTLSLLVIAGHEACAEDTLLLKYSFTGEHIYINPTQNIGNSSTVSGVSVISMAAEYVSEIDYNFEIGLGSKFHFSTWDGGSGSALYFPLYAIINYYPFSTENPFFLTTQFGRNIMFAYDSFNTEEDISDCKGSLCFEIGAGLRLFNCPQVRLEATYYILKGSCYFKEENYFNSTYEYDDLPYLPATLDYTADVASSSLIKITLSLGL